MPSDEFMKPVVSAHVRGPKSGTSYSRDDLELVRLGKKPELKRNFGFLAILGFSCTVLVTWEGTLVLFLSGLTNGGPSGIIYGYIVVWIGTLSIFATLSELVSMAPTSAGQYHWVAMLAPRSTRKFLSYLTGWLTLTGWQAFVASAAYLTGTLIQGVIILCHPDYLERFQAWHGTLLFWAIVLASLLINTSVGTTLARFEGIVLVLHILGFFAIILPLALLGEPTTSENVWNSWLNLGGWQTQGLSFSVGILGNVFSFIGADGAIHMSEEIRNAAMVVPRSLLTGLMINGTLGFAMLVVFLYFLGDITVAQAENPLYPFMSVLSRSIGSTTGAAVMSAVIIVMGFSTTTGVLASTSRIYWAFARDRGLPFWRQLRQVNPKTGIPFYSVLVTAFIAIVLSLVNIGGTAAFTGVISISISGLFGSYLIASSLLLYRRLTGGIRAYQSGADDPEDEERNGITTTATAAAMDRSPRWGPWRLPSGLGAANNAFTCAFLSYTLFFSFWPTYREVTVANFNYAVLVTVVVLVFSVIYYFAWARKVFKGPIVEATEADVVQMH